MMTPSPTAPVSGPELVTGAVSQAANAPEIVLQRLQCGALVPAPCTGLRMGRGLGLGIGGGLS